MNDDKFQNQLLEPLKIALKLELEGKRLFEEAAQNTSSKLAKQTFEFLAKEENRHIKKIEDFYKSLELSGGKDIPDIEDSKAEDKFEEFNKMLEVIKDEFKSTDTDVEAYKLALKFENGAEEFYEKKKNETIDKGIIKFYQWLFEEESMHSRLIKSCLQFVENPTEWFQKRKKV